MSFRRQGAERTAEVAITRCFHVADSVQPVSEVVARHHGFGHVFRTECLSNYLAKFFNVAQTGVVEYFPRQERQRADRWTTGDHNYFWILRAGIRSKVQHAVEAVCQAG